MRLLEQIALEADIIDFAAARQRARNRPASQARRPSLQSPSKTSVAELPKRTKSSVKQQVDEMIKRIGDFWWIDDDTAVAYYDPGTFVNVVQEFDRTFGDRRRISASAYAWFVGDVEIDVTLDRARRIIVEVIGL